MRAAAIQFNSTEDVISNREGIERIVRAAASAGASFIALPETVHYRGKLEQAPKDTLPGKASNFIGGLSKELGVWIHGGSIAEKAPDGRSYNTAFITNPSGKIVLSYRKIHLFDIDLESENVRMMESKNTAAGADVSVTEIMGFPVTSLVCYDLRFPEIWGTLRLKGADVFVLPSNFTEKTGEAHWKTLLRARAIENQSYVIAPAQWGPHPQQGFNAYGHAMIVDPWGEVLDEASGFDNSYVIAELNREKIETIRRRMPVAKHRRSELYFR